MSGADAPAAPGGPLGAGLLTSRARSAARAGDFERALQLLYSVRDSAAGEGDRAVLDLLARVHAQRGEPARAAGYWRLVQEQHPEDPDAAAGLARIERLGQRGPGAALARHRARTALVCAVCAVAALAGGVVVLGEHTGERARPPGAARADERADDAERTARHPEAERRAERAREAEQAREAARRTGAAEALASTLRLPGMRPEVHGHSVEVTFTQGLFSEGARLTPAGAARLAALGEHLSAPAARIEILGHTASVPGAPRSGGSVTALWRALVAARELSAASGRPLAAFGTASADQRDAPYDTPSRNRTATVVITPD